MAEEPSIEDEDEYDYMHDYEEYEMFDDDALTSFRMFQQRNSDEDIEEEPEEHDEDDDDETISESTNTAPNIETLTRQLMNRGVTFEDLVTYALWVDQEDFRIERQVEREQYYRTYNVINGQFRAVIHNYRRNRSRT
jgi:hypothetical protein